MALKWLWCRKHPLYLNMLGNNIQPTGGSWMLTAPSMSLPSAAVISNLQSEPTSDFRNSTFQSSNYKPEVGSDHRLEPIAAEGVLLEGNANLQDPLGGCTVPPDMFKCWWVPMVPPSLQHHWDICPIKYFSVSLQILNHEFLDNVKTTSISRQRWEQEARRSLLNNSEKYLEVGMWADVLKFIPGPWPQKWGRGLVKTKKQKVCARPV